MEKLEVENTPEYKNMWSVFTKLFHAKIDLLDAKENGKLNNKKYVEGRLRLKRLRRDLQICIDAYEDMSDDCDMADGMSDVADLVVSFRDDV